MNHTIRFATTLLFFGVVVGGEEGHVFTIQIRKPQKKEATRIIIGAIKRRVGV